MYSKLSQRLIVCLCTIGAFIILAGISQKSLDNGGTQIYASLEFPNAGNRNVITLHEDTQASIEAGNTICHDLDKARPYWEHSRINITNEMDIMKMKKLPFIRSFKNPCWYSNGTLLCLPYMFLVGLAKCGTTDLFMRITLHPDFVAPTMKEPSWLSRTRFHKKSNLHFYASMFFSPLSKKLEMHPTSHQSFITGDGSVNTFLGSQFWRQIGANVGHDEPVHNNPEYIHHLNNNTKILINLRNPIDKLWSQYLAFSKNVTKSAKHFHEIVERELRVYKECIQFRTLRSCMYDRPLGNYAMMDDVERQRMCSGTEHRPRTLISLRSGVYHVFIKDYLHVFPRVNVLIQRLEDISEDRNKTLIRTYNFLGLNIPSETVMRNILNRQIRNPRKKMDKKIGDMLQATRYILHTFYKPHNEKLAILLNDTRYNYGQSG